MGSSLSGEPMTHTEERRAARRSSIRVPIGVPQLGEGITFDISATGVAFEIARTVGPDPPADLRFALYGRGVLLRCFGRVVRIEERDCRTLLAVTIDQMEIVPVPDDVVHSGETTPAMARPAAPAAAALA
jgi:hypothetical protein